MSDVDDWLDAYDNPMNAVVRRVRTLILAADPRVAECIKWKSPTFTYKGNIASFNPRSRKHASLMFHTGASIPGDHPHLTGSGDVARYMTFADEAEVDARAAELQAVVRAWCAWRDG